MIVVALSRVPASLKGILSRWLFEVSPGVYVGNISVRVREELWNTIEKSIKSGRAVMIHPAKGEQHFRIRTINSTWTTEMSDGFQLLMRPENSCKKHNQQGQQFIILDLETTGLDSRRDRIIEIGALKIKDGIITDKYQTLIKYPGILPKSIVSLTGITDELLMEKGTDIAKALEEFIDFAGNIPIVAYNAPFEEAFLNYELSLLNRTPIPNKFIDILSLTRQYIRGLPCYKLQCVANHLDVKIKDGHRALSDCFTLFGIVVKLNEMFFEAGGESLLKGIL